MPDEETLTYGILCDGWFPTRWGRGDQRGNGNLQGPKKALEARDLIRTGEVVRLGYPYSPKMPMDVGRTYTIHMPGGPTGGPVGKRNRGVWNDEYVATEIGQVGTHMDALGHFGCMCGAYGDNRNMLFYNGNRLSEMWSAYGLKRLGIEHAPVFFTRGVLFDMEALKGRCLRIGEEITVADLKACLERQKMPEKSISPGDVVLIRTGHAARYIDDLTHFYDGAPGIGFEAAKWLGVQEPSVVGADTPFVEANPNPDPDVHMPCHSFLITGNGIYLHENMKLDDLGKREIYEFAYSFTPLPIVGGTGSIGTPLAIL